MSRHMSRRQLCTVSMCHISIWVSPCSFSGLRDFFKRQKILRGRISEFFFTKIKTQTRHICRDECNI